MTDPADTTRTTLVRPGPQSPRPRPSDPRLAGRRVLVTGCGGPAGVAVLRELTTLDVTPVAADCDPYAAGLHLGHQSYLLPTADSPDYPDRLLAAATATGSDAVIVTVAEELLRVAGNEAEFAERGIAAWFPAHRTVADCLDKWAFAARIDAAGVAAPGTALDGPGDLPGPWIVKPRVGRGSRDVYPVDDPADFPTLLRRVPAPLVQTRLPGREFTVDCLIGRDGAVLGAVPRWRAQTRAGISTRGTTFADSRIDLLVKELAGALDLTAVCNVQGFLDDEGPARVVEVNPRFSGGLPLSLAAGADLVGQFLLGTLGLPIDPTALVATEGVTTVRWFAESTVEQRVDR
ncbi:carbamoyl-phosphate synthase large subunit [Micromonospora pisi]|uniref:Carbamoyl-phosphate synthase large subunit n=1 Tax=Micromonospora pisi TaxID=589240 RepID=A0A495JW17_9ACTN|nr:ATP-grasp domain-containing protein [Micromonospora pisi]RKR92532.1 carbamoyl-phosphate synthase large subunit [Micromonospora pisi]